jgi:hypothetical protein
MNPFDYVNAINKTKKDLMTGGEDDQQAEKDYVPFVVNRSLSYFPDTLMYVNEINQYPDLDKKLQFHFLLNSIRSGKRFSKWVKKEDSADLLAVMQYYGYGVDKAKQALPLLSNEQLSIIKTIITSGVEHDKYT